MGQRVGDAVTCQKNKKIKNATWGERGGGGS